MKPGPVLLLRDGVEALHLGPKAARALAWIVPDLVTKGADPRAAVQLSRGSVCALEDLPARWSEGEDFALVTPRRYPARALDGLRVVVTREAAAADDLVFRLQSLGASVQVRACLEIRPAPAGPLRRELRQLDTFDWVAFTSRNAVERFEPALLEAGLDWRSCRKLAAVGPATASALRARGLRPDFVAREFSGRSLGSRLRGRILHPTSEPHSPDFALAARRGGAVVVEPVVYRIARPRRLEALGPHDLVVLGSSQTARNFAELARPAKGSPAAAIGPRTAETARRLGFRVVVQPKAATFPDLVDAVAAWWRKAKP